MKHYKFTLKIVFFYLLSIQSILASESFSQANQLLFFTDHLSKITGEQTLDYSFIQSGKEVENFSDTVTLNISQTASENRTIKAQFFTGERTRWTPDFSERDGNPVLILFLQNDIHGMQDTHDGQWRLFQKYIKIALEESATLTNKTITLDGKEVVARKIQIKPFTDKRFNTKIKEKTYDFIVSDDVPGGIYEISSIIVSDNGLDKEIIERKTLTLQ